MVDPRIIMPIFFVVWAALAVGGLLFFTLNKDVALKRRLYPRLTIVAGVVFGLVMALVVPWPATLLFIPFIGLITWLNIRMTRFCDGCGKILINQQWWTQMNYCPYCGKKL